MSSERFEIKSLELKEVTWMDSSENVVFSNLSQSFQIGENYLIKGATGKSSLLRVLAGLLEPTKGEYLVNGECVNDLSFDEFRPYRLNFGFSFDVGGLINNQSLYNNLVLPLQYHKVMNENEIENRVLFVLNHFNLLYLRDKRPAEVTGRIRKITVLARSLILKPQIIMWDEPTPGLTPEDYDNLMSFLDLHRSEFGLKTLIMITRNEGFIRKYAPKVVQIQSARQDQENETK